jgi:hypothetical protein
VSAFASPVKTLEVPDRPATPAFTIDFANETTGETVSGDIQYSTKSDFSISVAGNGSRVSLTPGADVYFRQPATAGTFKSLIQTLDVPSRPVVTSAITDSTSSSPFQVNITFPTGVTGFDAGDILVTNGAVSNLTGTYQADITPSAKGFVTAQILANAVSEGNFMSNTLSIKYVDKISVISDITGIPFHIYPNPTDGKIWFRLPAGVDVSQLTFELYNITGQLVKSFSNLQESGLDLSDQLKGMYTLRIRNSTSGRIEKIVLK